MKVEIAIWIEISKGLSIKIWHDHPVGAELQSRKKSFHLTVKKGFYELFFNPFANYASAAAHNQ